MFLQYIRRLARLSELRQEFHHMYLLICIQYLLLVTGRSYQSLKRITPVVRTSQVGLVTIEVAKVRAALSVIHNK